MKRHLQNDRGISLIELIIAAGMIVIIALGMASFMSNQASELASLKEKLFAREAETTIKSLLLNPAYCSCIFRGNTFNTTTSTWATPLASLPANFTNVPAFPAACTPDTYAVVPPVGSTFAGTNMTVQGLSIVNATEIVPNSGEYTASIQLQIGNTVRPMRAVLSGFKFAVDTAAPANARPFTNCLGNLAAGAGTTKGFCTPKVDWDNSNTLPCGAITGFSIQRLQGVFNSIYRSSSCCYIPDLTGSGGWCSDPIEGWSGSFSGCGAGTANYTATEITGSSAGGNDTHYCCFIPTTKPAGITDIFGTKNIGASSSHSPNCGGPYTDYGTIFQNVVAAGLGRNVSCTFYSR